MDQNRYFEQIKLLSGMAMLLQSCEVEEDISDVIYWYLPKLFPNFTGVIHLLKSERSVDNEKIETLFSWPEDFVREKSNPNIEHCRAFVYGSAIESLFGSNCNCSNCCSWSLCLPLRDGSKSIGLFCLECNDDYQLSSPDKGVIFMAAEYLSLSISNLRLKKHLQESAIRDPLTQLFNRRYLDSIIGKEMIRSKDNDLSFGLIIIDLDFFKEINDSYGHYVGDIVLKKVATVLLGQSRDEDVACRYGGEEFMMLLPASDLEFCVQRAESLRKAVKDIVVKSGGEKIPNITASFGVALYPRHGANYEELYIAADDALYNAKKGGRDRVIVVD
ncbi:MAG: GGDEF domain-containing protein [Desulfotalea sp.]